MADVKSRRRYDSSGRQAQARRNRVAMLQAALGLLLGQGYAATSLPQVAAGAGVSPHTAYRVFRNKPTLVKAVFDYALAGDVEPVPILHRERTLQIRAETDPRKKIDLYVAGLGGILERTAPLQLLARTVAQTDVEIARVWQQIQQERLTGMTQFAQHLSEQGHLNSGLSLDEVRDVLWTYTSPELYELLVLQRQWTGTRYCEWIGNALKASILTG